MDDAVRADYLFPERFPLGGQFAAPDPFLPHGVVPQSSKRRRLIIKQAPGSSQATEAAEMAAAPQEPWAEDPAQAGEGGADASQGIGTMADACPQRTALQGELNRRRGGRYRPDAERDSSNQA